MAIIYFKIFQQREGKERGKSDRGNIQKYLCLLNLVVNSGPGLEPHENAQALTPESAKCVHSNHRAHAVYMDGGWACVCSPVHESYMRRGRP